MKTYHWIWYALLVLVFMMGFIIRVSDLFDAPLDFHATRQLHSALIARGMYYQGLDSAPEWKQAMAYNQWQAEGLIEPQIMETLTALGYRVFGSEQLWIARLWAIFFWMIGGVFLFLITEEIADFASGTFAVVFYMIWPYAAIASRAFQPEPLLIAAMLAALWAFMQWMRSEKWAWAILAGLLSGFALYVKSSAIFFLAPAFASVVLQRFSFKKAIRNKQVWLIMILSTLPYLIYLFFGTVVLNILGRQFDFRFFPGRWIQPLFYIQWLLELDKTIQLVIVMAAVMGISLFTKKKYFMLLVGFLLGYVIYGFAFSYHITTHDYYHLPLIIPVSIGIGIILGKIFRVSERNHTITRVIFALAALLFIGFYSWQIRSELSRYNYSEEVNDWEQAGEYIGREARVIGVFKNYGYRLAYWGWNYVSSWTTMGDVTLRELAGQEIDLQRQFDDRIANYDFFVVGDRDEFERQAFLKEYFETNFLKVHEIGDILIYDLRATNVDSGS
jgi:4-amino-4-deoxy-L-arabinose transferase-like glycosyltransferase